MFLILTLIVLVAAFNIVSGMIMLVKDKGSDIAILRTMGASQSSILRIFLITGASIGVVGTVVGLLLGTLVCLNVESIRQFPVLAHQHRVVPAGALFPVAPAGRHGRQGDHGGGGDGARAVAVGDTVPVLARGRLIRSRRFAMNEAITPPAATAGTRVAATRDDDDSPLLYLQGIDRHYSQARRGSKSSKVPSSPLWPGQSIALVAPPAPASRPCCMSPGSLSSRMAARLPRQGRDLAPLGRRADPLAPHRNRFRLPVPPSAARILGVENVVLPQMIRGPGVARRGGAPSSC